MNFVWCALFEDLKDNPDLSDVTLSYKDGQNTEDRVIVYKFL